jgi:hypothetical protein
VAIVGDLQSSDDKATTDRCLRERSQRRLVGPSVRRRTVPSSPQSQRLEAPIAELRKEVDHLSRSLDDADSGSTGPESTVESAE